MNYLHIGGDTVLPAEDIIAVFDLDNASYSARTREFLRLAQQNGRVVSATEELPKSFVLCRQERDWRVYLSFLNAATLLKRLEADTIE